MQSSTLHINTDTTDDESFQLLGVAISRQQSRLTSPKTPAVEKEQALHGQGGFFNDINIIPEVEEVTKEKEGRLETTRSFLRNALSRSRASSGSEISFDGIHKAILSIPKKFSLQSGRNLPQTNGHRRAGSGVEVAKRPSLRRVVSDDSLSLGRALSQVSSLGDDSRFQDIHAQVNSRFKALKDSWNDSNIKLPSIASLRSEIFGSQEPTDPLTRSPFHSMQEATADLTEHASPHLTQALSRLEGDVVVLGGYRGSVLRSATPPNKQLWVPIKVGLNLRKVDLEVGIKPEDDLKPADDIIPDGMLTHIGPVDISRRLFKKLRTCEAYHHGKLRVHDYGFDWRLDPLFLSQQLCNFLDSLGGQVTVIAHSLGGLITRHAMNKRPDLFKAVLFAGVPTRCINILGPLRNGDDVLLSSRVLTAQVNFTIRTSFALLPLDGRCFIDKYTHEEYPIDFFNAKTWLTHRLSPCIARPLVALRASGGIISTVTAAARKISISRPKGEPDTLSDPTAYHQSDNAIPDQMVEPTVSTTVTLPFDEAYTYLERMLARVKRFKQEMDFNPDIKYPPLAVIYGKNTPTVIGAKVNGIDGIRRVDSYDDLAFGSGDGVVLARAAMLPDGYTAVRGGIISSERGHVSLLGDLEAVGKALLAMTADQHVA